MHAESGCSYNCEYYKKEYIDDSSKVGFSLSYDFTYDNYSDSTIANELSLNFPSSYDGKFLTISGNCSRDFINSYDLLNDVNISI